VRVAGTKEGGRREEEGSIKDEGGRGRGRNEGGAREEQG
jgi:hypothetical protein